MKFFKLNLYKIWVLFCFILCFPTQSRCLSIGKFNIECDGTTNPKSMEPCSHSDQFPGLGIPQLF